MLPPSPSRSAKSRLTSPVKTIRSKVVVPFPSPSSATQPIKTYLRLRPADPSKASGEPYITVHNDTDIVMTPPPDLPRAPQQYSFAKVFQPVAASEADSSQEKFFQETCVPMIEGLLNEGQSGLYCTYGTTCSGKSYTVHGGKGKNEAGVLPRTLDTVFNSLQGVLSTRHIRPKGLNGVEELLDERQGALDQFDPLSLPPLRKKLLSGKSRPTVGGSGGANNGHFTEYEHESTTLKVDKNYRYSVWLSYLEVYNEKMYDLLDVGEPGINNGASKNWSLGGRRIGSVIGTEGVVPPSNQGGGSVLTRHALSLQTDADTAGDPDGQCKYAVGLSEHEVHTAEEARALIRRGEQNRAVFGTMANRVSSRSHGVFTVRIIRHHAGEQGENAMYATSRMSIVDLAGSERMANTQLTDSARMKEAGNINRSLMNLGHCIEKVRINQARLQGMLATGGVECVKPEMVPYNSSKLTSLLKAYFVGEGSTVMIITANPYDSGFYETGQVMKFSANVRDVTQPRQVSAVPRSPTKVSLAPSVGRRQGASISSPRVTGSAVLPSISSFGTHVGRPTPARTSEPSENDITIIEEGDDEPQDPLVDLLIAECEGLQQRLYIAEQRTATIEASVRAEMADKMESALKEMRDVYQHRMENEQRLGDQFANKKLDLLNELCQEPKPAQESFESASASFRSVENQSFKVNSLPAAAAKSPIQAASPNTGAVSSSGLDSLANAFDRVRIASETAPVTPSRRLMVPVIPEAQRPANDPFCSTAFAPNALAPRESFGGSPTRAVHTSPDVTNSDGQSQPAPTDDAAADVTTIEMDVSSAGAGEEGAGLIHDQAPRIPSSIAQASSQAGLSHDEVAQQDESQDDSDEDSEDDSEDDQDDSFDPSFEGPSSQDVTPPPPSPVKRRSARASTAANTLAATTRFREHKLSVTKGRTASRSNDEQAASIEAPRATQTFTPAKPKTRAASVLQSTRPSAAAVQAAVQAAACLAPAPATVRGKRSVLNRTRASGTSNASRTASTRTPGTVKRVRPASTTSRTRVSSHGLLSEAGAHLANRRPVPSAPIDLDLSSDVSLLKPPADSPKKKRRALRASNAVDEEAMALQLENM